MDKTLKLKSSETRSQTKWISILTSFEKPIDFLSPCHDFGAWHVTFSMISIGDIVIHRCIFSLQKEANWATCTPVEPRSMYKTRSMPHMTNIRKDLLLYTCMQPLRLWSCKYLHMWISLYTRRIPLNILNKFSHVFKCLWDWRSYWVVPKIAGVGIALSTLTGKWIQWYNGSLPSLNAMIQSCFPW